MSDSPSRRIDLDAARAARDEKRGPAPVVIFGGEEYQLPPELPASLLDSLGSLQRGSVEGLSALLTDMFGEEQYSKLRSSGTLTFDDLMFLVNAVVDSYGISLGE